MHEVREQKILTGGYVLLKKNASSLHTGTVFAIPFGTDGNLTEVAGDGHGSSELRRMQPLNHPRPTIASMCYSEL